jgi:hypothetical protein
MPAIEKLAEADISTRDTTFRQRDVRAKGEKRAMKPYRIQLKRTKGWRMPANTVKVDRSTRWGNPFKVDYKGMTPELGLIANIMFAIILAYVALVIGRKVFAGKGFIAKSLR